MKKNKETIIIDDKIGTYEDKSGARLMSIPIIFPSSVRGAIVICHLQKAPWFPEKEIKSIIINWKD